jgi:hypothetical protein
VVRELVTDELIPTLRYRPSTGAALPFSAVFRESVAVAGVKTQLVSSWRHQRFVPFGTASSGRAVQVTMESGHGAAETQVFGVVDAGPRLAANVRFFGFTSSTGLLTLPELLPGEDLFALGPDGSTAFAADVAAFGMAHSLMLVPTGRVLVSEHVRQVVGSDWLTLRFQRINDSLQGMAPEAYRFASPATAFEVADLPAGEYRVTVGQSVFSVIVSPGGFTVLE